MEYKTNTYKKCDIDYMTVHQAGSFIRECARWCARYDQPLDLTSSLVNAFGPQDSVGGPAYWDTVKLQVQVARETERQEGVRLKQESNAHKIIEDLFRRYITPAYIR